MFSKLFNKKKKEKTVSKGGSRIYRHHSSTDNNEPAVYMTENENEAFDKHIEKYIGKIESVFDEIVSEYTHIDVYWVAPTEERPFHTLITGGMSLKPMNVPKGSKLKYGELMLCLPPTWKLSQKDLEDENNYWPIRWLKILARFPHEHNIWLSRGHTIPNDKPFAPNTKLSCMYVMVPMLFPSEFVKYDISPQKTIWFYSIIPLYPTEMQFKLDKGADALEELLLENGVSELLDPKRKSIITLNTVSA